MKELKNIFFTLKSINRKFTIVVVLAWACTSCLPADEWSPYKSNAEINATIVSSVASTLSGTTIGDPSFTWSLSMVQGGDFCKVVTKAGFVGEEFSLRFSAKAYFISKCGVNNGTSKLKPSGHKTSLTGTKSTSLKA